MKKLNKNNKGFSLVELIVVIAIMAVLVGVAAPQFMGYVTKSKKATDVKNGQEIAAAIQVAIADETVVFSDNSKDWQKVEDGSGIGANLITGKMFSSIPAMKTSGQAYFAVYDRSTGKVEIYGAATDATKANGLTEDNMIFPSVGDNWK